VVASVDDARRKLTLSIVQKLADRPLKVRLDLHGLEPAGREITLHRLTGGEDLLAANTLENPNRVGMETKRTELATTWTLPPASLTVLEMQLTS
jgi:alpha-L-arabinofuranosidase